MHRSPSRRLSALAGLFVLSLLSCGREVTGPDDGSLFGRVADLAVAPSLPGPMSVVDGSGSVVPFNRVRVILQRTNGEELLSRIVDFPAAATEVPLSLEFPLPPDAPRDGLPLQLLLRYLNVAGDTVFAGGPVQVIAQPRVEGQEPQQVPVELEWVGPGSEAAWVEIAPATDTVVSGTTTTFTAVAFDAFEAVVEGAPIVFSTPDPTIASLSAPGSGAVTWLAVRGPARVIASLPSGEADTAFVDVELPPSLLQVVSGNGQSGVAGSPLSAPVVFRVAAADGVPVEGVTVRFNIALGGGAISADSAVSDANGDVSVSWTMGEAGGPQALEATFDGLGARVVVTATITTGPPSGLRTWTGGVDAVWSNPANWENGLVPTPLNTVLLTAAATFDPALALTDSVVISGLTIEDGASIAIGNAALVVVGSLTAPTTPSITVVEGGLALLGTTGTVQGTLPTAFFGGGAYSLSGALDVQGDLSVTNGTFTVDGFPVTVQGDFFTGGTGVLAMLPGSVMTVSGSTIFTGGSTAGFLSGGRLNIGGDFVQSGATSPSSFSADAGHETWFTSAVPQSITFLTPGTGPTLSHFGTLYSSQATGGTIDLASDVWVDGALETGIAITAKRFTGAGETIYSRGADIDAAGIQFEGVQWHLLDGALVQAIQSVTFTAMDPTVTQWRIARAGGPITVPGLVFQTLLDGGLFLEVEDTAPLDQNVLTVDVTGVVPEAHEGGLSQLGGAQVIGWLATAGFRWTGTTSTDWATASNWAGGVVPTVADSVHIPAGTLNAPVLTTATAIRTLTMEPGTTLDHGTSILTIAGSLDLPPTAQITGAPGGRILLAVGIGNAGTVRGTVYDVWINEGDYALAGDLTIAAGLDIYFGDLSIGNFTLTVGTSIFVGQAGTMTMTGTGVVDVVNMDFDGASTAGRLTNGTLRVRGRFDQIATESDQGFSASGAHVVELIGTATQNVWLRSADSSLTTGCTRSCFATLRAIKAPGSGGVRFLTSVKALTELTLQADSIAAPAYGLVSTGRPVFDSPILRAASIAYRDSLVQNSSAQTIDSLIAWGVGTPLATIPGVRTVVAGAPLIRGLHTSDVDVLGSLDVDGPARIAGELSTTGVGTLRMLEAVDSLDVDGIVNFAGGPTTGLLTAGTLTIGANFNVGTNPSAFDASGTHRVRMAGPLDTATVTIGSPATSQFARLEVARPVRLNSETHVGSDLVLTATGSLVGVGPLVVDGAITSDPAAAILVDELFVGGALTLPTIFAVPRVTLTGTGQAVPYNVSAMPYLAITGTAVASFPAGGDFSINPDTIVVDGGELRVGFPGDDAFLDVDVLRTQNGGRLRMQDANASINVNAAASFAGGSTAGLLTAGQINIYGTEFVQGGGAPDAYSANLGHATRFLNFDVGATATFANPGGGVGNSHFGDLEIAMGNEGAALTILSDLYAVGTLRTGDNFQRRLESAVPRRVFSNGANVTSISLSNVSWTLGDGQPVTAMEGVFFENMSPTVEQLRIERAAGTIPLTTPTFTTRPTSGRYVTVRDTDGSGDLVLAVSGADPTSHGGYAVAENTAQITGWTEAGLYTWNAGGGDWNNPLAWSPQLVPGPADIALVPSFANGAPAVASGDTARIGVLRYETTIPFVLSGHLMVRDSLGSFGASSISCSGGGVILNNPAGGAVPFILSNPNCTLDVLNGTARPTALSQAGAVRVAGDGLLDLNGRRLDATFFSTSENGRLRMVNLGDSLVLSGPASFGGGSTAGLLTNGNLLITGGLTQTSGTSTTSFRASGSHFTRFQGGGSSALNFESPGAAASGFATLISNKIAGTPLLVGTSSGLHVLGAMQIISGNFTIFGPATALIGADLLANAGSTIAVETGATLTTTACTGTGTYTGAGTYVGAGCP